MAATVAKRKCNILLLGKSGAGKSSVARQIIGNEYFDAKSVPQISTIEYNLKVIDTVGLFDVMVSKQAIEEVKAFWKSRECEGVHLIIFVFRCGRFTPEEVATFRHIRDSFKGQDISDISALVITHCEDKSAKARERIVSDLTEDMVKFMKKGVVCVGFPHLNDLDEDLMEVYKRKAQKDVEQLHMLIKESNDVRLQKQCIVM